MEDDGDDKDDSKRRTRNLSEKKRRDHFNMLVTELSTLIATNNRKMDKSTVLKSTISFLKNHNEITVRSRAHDVQEDWKPAFLSNEEFTYLVLEALEGFVMVFSACGRIYYVSESITSLLGHNPVDIVNRNIFDLTFEEDRPNLYDLLQRNAIATEQMPNTSKESEMITFQLHLRRGTLGFREEASYDLVQFYGHFRSNQDQVDEDRDRTMTGYQQDNDSRMLFICIGRLYTPQLIRDVSLVDSSRNEFTSRHSLEWKFLFLDHRAPPIIGYLPFEVLGTSGYDYYHFDDLEKVVTCHEALMQKGELTSCYYRFLTKGQQWIWLQTRFYITYHQWNSKPEFVVCTHRVVSYADVVKTTKEEGVEDADVSETDANQNSIKDTPNDGDDPMPPMSPSYASEAASDAYGSYQPISQSTLVGLQNIQCLKPSQLAEFAQSMVMQDETPPESLPITSDISLFDIPLTDVEAASLPELLSPSEQSALLQPENTSQSSNAVLPTPPLDSSNQVTTQTSAATSPSNSLTDKVLQTDATLSHSTTVEQAISQSKIAIQALSQSNAALRAISCSHAPIQVMLQSNAVQQAILQSNAAMQAISQSNAAIQVISQLNAVIRAISQSNMQAMSQSDEDVKAIIQQPLLQSNAAMQAISQSNATTQAISQRNVEAISQSDAKAMLQLEEEIQSIMESNALQSNAVISHAIQPISKSNPEKQAISKTPAITKPPLTSIPTILLTSVSPSYSVEMASDDFSNTFPQNLLATPSPVPQTLSPSHKSDHSDNHSNFFQTISQATLRTPPPDGRSAYDKSESNDSINHSYASFYGKRGTETLSVRTLPALSPIFLFETNDTYGNSVDQDWQPASVKSASAGSTAGTINTAATKGASWPQARYAAGSDAGSLSGESRSSQRNSERESHKTTETSVPPQHVIGSQYVDPAAYDSIVPVGMMPISPVLVTSDHAQIQAQLQRKHEELQQMIVRQQEELRQVKEQLLLARLGLLQPLNIPNPYSTPEEIQNQQRMSAQLAYTNSPPRAIGYPQQVPLPMSALATNPPHPQPHHPQHPQHQTQPQHPQHQTQPPHPPHAPHPSEPHQHMPQ